MLTSLRLERFKSWADTGVLRLAPITGLFGTNSSGKTSILQLLLLLKQTVESTDRAQVLQLGGDRALVDLGTFPEVVHGHTSPGSLGFSFSWSPAGPFRLVDPAQSNAPLAVSDELAFTAAIREANSNASSRPIVDEFRYQLRPTQSNYHFGMKRKPGAGDQYEIVTSPFDLKRFRGRPTPLPPPVKFYGFPDQVYAAYQNAGFLADLQLELEELFAGVYYLGPLREYPRRQYTWAGAQPSDMGQRGERVIDALLASRDRAELVKRGRRRQRRPLDWIVADWLKRLGLIHAFSVDPVAPGSNLYQVHVQKTPSAPRVLVTDVGFGVSQILPVLVLCYYVP
ncbi:MAG: DUF3696 domain-containing protein, partial [Chloroflexi bacterium]|nr:DUF3696 domain-containing protein [Chloroflexota bacterium]